MGKFDKFNQSINLENLNKQMEDIKANGGGNYQDLPAGKYRVKLVKMEVGACGEKAKTPGAPLLKADFKVVSNKHKNQHMFLNKVLYTERNDDSWNMGKLMMNVVGWINTLEPSDDVGPVIFENYNQFSDLIMDIAEDVSDLEYDVEYNPDAFNSIKIVEAYE